MCELKGINRFSLRQILRLLLTLFESKPHIIIIFHLKTNGQKLEKHHVNGSQTRRASVAEQTESVSEINHAAVNPNETSPYQLGESILIFGGIRSTFSFFAEIPVGKH